MTIQAGSKVIVNYANTARETIRFKATVISVMGEWAFVKGQCMEAIVLLTSCALAVSPDLKKRAVDFKQPKLRL